MIIIRPAHDPEVPVPVQVPGVSRGIGTRVVREVRLHVVAIVLPEGVEAAGREEEPDIDLRYIAVYLPPLFSLMPDRRRKVRGRFPYLL
jgi:hypothetical protein